MTANLIVEQLTRLPLFRGLSLVQLSEIARHGERTSYNPGAVIIEEKADAEAAILIISGEAARVSGPDLKSRLELVSPGSLLGEAAMLVETFYGSTVVAREHVEAMRITRDRLHAQMVRDPAVAEHLVVNLAARLWRLADDLRQVDATLASKPSRSTFPPKAAPSARLAAPVN